LKVYGYGDSITRDDFPPYWRNWCGVATSPELDCIPRGVSGERTIQGVDRFLVDLAAGSLDDAEGVVFAWGANDFGRADWELEAATIGPLRLGIDAAQEAGLEVGLIVPPPQFLPGISPPVLNAANNLKIEAVRDGLDALALETGATVADSYGAFLETGEALPEFYWDHVHPNFDGSAITAELVVSEPATTLALMIGLVALAALAGSRNR